MAKKGEDKEVVRFISMDHDITLIRENDTEHIVGGRVVRVPHKKIVFNGPYFQTSDPEEIEHIRGLDSFGSRVFENIIPDDMVVVGTEKITKYICSYPECNHVEFTKAGIKAHKKSVHKRAGSLGTKKSKKSGESAAKDMVED